MRLPPVFLCGLTLLFALTGCGPSLPGEALTLEFEERRIQVSVDDATADAGPISHSFHFRVWNQSAVTIRSITASCTCTHASTDLTGKSLEPGTAGTIHVSVDPRGRTGRFTAMVTIETFPPSPQPVVLATELVIASRPTVSPEPLIVRQILGANAETTLRVVRVRESSVPPLELSPTNSDFGPFVLSAVLQNAGDHSPNAAPSQSAAGVHDELILTLTTSSPQEIGEHPFQLHLGWKRGLRPTTVQGQIQVIHPVEPQLKRVFLQVPAGASRELRIALVNHRPEQYQLLDVTCDLDAIDARLSENRDAIDCTVRPQYTFGKQSGTIRVTFADASAPPLVIPLGLLVASAGPEPTVDETPRPRTRPISRD